MSPWVETEGGRSDPALVQITLALQPWLPSGFVLVAAPSRLDRVISAQERCLVSRAVPARQADFITGRWCAHRALHALGCDGGPLGVGPLGAPDWPGGISGSITHDRGWCLVTAGPQAAAVGIGIDLYAKADHSVLPGLALLIHSPREQVRYATALRSPEHLRRLFCIKEAVVKAVSRLAGRFLDLRDIDVVMRDGRFEARVAGVPAVVGGHHADVSPGVVALARTLPA